MLTSDLPHHFLSLSTNVINSFSVGLVRILHDGSKSEHVRLIGSGTLVNADKEYGILTAHHVLEDLYHPCELGLVLVEGEHRWSIPVQELELVEIAVPGIAGLGPDLAFIGIPRLRIYGIQMFKQFYNLSLDRDEMLSDPPDPPGSVWFVNGIPNEFTRDDLSAGGFDIARTFEGLCGAGGANRIFEEIGYDYVEVIVQYKDDAHLPRTFGGISGGGLWQVPVRIVDGNVSAIRYLFVGMPISENEEIVDNERTILCHGWKSIYDICYDTIISRCS